MKNAIWIVNGILLLGLLAFIVFFAYNSARDNYDKQSPTKATATDRTKSLSPNEIPTSSKIIAVQQYLVRAKNTIKEFQAQHKITLENPPDDAERLLAQERIQRLQTRRTEKEAEQKKSETAGDAAAVTRLNKEIAEIAQEISSIELISAQIKEQAIRYQTVKAQIDKMQSDISTAEKDLKDLNIQLKKENSGAASK